MESDANNIKTMLKINVHRFHLVSNNGFIKALYIL